jgi:hypothetical protein
MKTELTRKTALLAALLLFLAPGCGAGTGDTGNTANMGDTAAAAGESSSAAEIPWEELSDWPENDYTSQLPKPQAGEPDYALGSPESGYYAVFLSGLTREEGEDYLDLLREAGFTEVESQANQVSGGWLLEKDSLWVSVSCSQGVLGICITGEEGLPPLDGEQADDGE